MRFIALSLALLFTLCCWGKSSSDSLINLPLSIFLDELYYIEADGKYEQVFELIDLYEQKETQKPTPDPLVFARLFEKKGIINQALGKTNDALTAFEKGLQLATEIPDSNTIGGCLSGIANCYIYSGDYEKAIEYYNKSYEIDEAFKNLEGMAVSLNSIGKIYEIWKQYDKALDFFFQSLEIAEKLDDEDLMAVRMASIGSAYKNLGKEDPENYNMALKWLNMALEIETKNNNRIRRAFRLDQIGEVYTLTNKTREALPYYTEALGIVQGANIKNSESIILNHIGLNYLKQNNYNQAQKYYHQSLNLAKETNFNNMIQKNLQELTSLYQQQGNYKSALETFQKFVEIKDSTFNVRSQNQVNEFKTKYESQEKEKELAIMTQEKLKQELQLNKARQNQIILVAFMFLLSLLAIAFYGQYRLKKRTQEHMIVVNDQLSQLNSTKDKLFSIVAHDMKNSMTGFCLIVDTLNKQLANLTNDQLKYFIEQLSSSANTLQSMMRNLLDWARAQQNNIHYTPSPTNIKSLINHSISQISHLAEAKNLTLNNHVDANLNMDTDQEILTSVIRNILSNAIKFSFDSSIIDIKLEKANNWAIISISDYGTGMEPNELQTLLKTNKYIQSKPGLNGEKGTGIGLRLSIDLLAKAGGKLSGTTTPGKGTTFGIELPVNQTLS